MSKRPLIREVQSDSELLKVLRLTAAAFKEEVAGAGMTFTQWVDLEYSYTIKDKLSWRDIGKASLLILLRRQGGLNLEHANLVPFHSGSQRGWPANDRENEPDTFHKALNLHCI
jgi:hypothetical protein